MALNPDAELSLILASACEALPPARSADAVWSSARRLTSAEAHGGAGP